MKKKYLILLFVILGLTSCDNLPVLVTKSDFLKITEYAYFEGQKDALTGDTRIKLNSDSVWVWSKSPWNDKSEPIYNPSISLDSNFK